MKHLPIYFSIVAVVILSSIFILECESKVLPADEREEKISTANQNHVINSLNVIVADREIFNRIIVKRQARPDPQPRPGLGPKGVRLSSAHLTEHKSFLRHVIVKRDAILDSRPRPKGGSSPKEKLKVIGHQSMNVKKTVLMNEIFIIIVTVLSALLCVTLFSIFYYWRTRFCSTCV